MSELGCIPWPHPARSLQKIRMRCVGSTRWPRQVSLVTTCTHTLRLSTAEIHVRTGTCTEPFICLGHRVASCGLSEHLDSHLEIHTGSGSGYAHLCLPYDNLVLLEKGCLCEPLLQLQVALSEKLLIDCMRPHACNLWRPTRTVDVRSMYQ